MGLVPARRPGWLLEGRGNPSPRGMAAQSRRKARWTEPGLQALWQFFRHCACSEAIQTRLLDCFVASLLAMTVKGRIWLGNRDQTTGDSRAGDPTAKAAKRPRYACAIARGARSLATVPRPRHRTAPSAGISAKRTPPNITRTGITSPA